GPQDGAAGGADERAAGADHRQAVPGMIGRDRGLFGPQRDALAFGHQDSSSSTLRAPSDSSSFGVAAASKRGSHDSIEMKKASSVTRSNTFDRNSGWVCMGSQLHARQTRTAA